MEDTTKKHTIRFSFDLQLRACLIAGGYLVKGHLDEFDFEAVLLFAPDKRGINKSRVIKLEVECMGGDKHFDIPRPVAFYHNKWENRPEDDYDRECVGNIIALLDQVRITNLMSD